MLKTKDYPVRVKLLDEESSSDSGDGTGVFEALVSVFGNKDSYGEIVMPGAFTNTLAAWQERGDPIPVYWSHRLDDPDFNIGHVLDAKEIDEGLYIKAQLDLENPKAKSTHNLLKSRRVTQFSFSFSVPVGGAKENDNGDIELSDLELYEVGPTPIGANPATELISAKAGRILSAKNVERITAARVALQNADSALAELLEITNGDDEKSQRVRKVKTDEPNLEAKVDELTRSMDWAESLILLAELEG